MTISVDAISQAYGTGVSSLTWNHTISGTGIGIVVLIGDQSNITGVTVGGHATSGQANTQQVSPPMGASTWGATGADGVTAGVNSIVASNSFAEDMVGFAVSMNGVKQAAAGASFNGSGATGTGTAVTLTDATSATGYLTLDLVVWDATGGATIAPSGTGHAQVGTTDTHLTSFRAAAAQIPGAASVALPWTLSASKVWTQSYIDVINDPAYVPPASGAPDPLFMLGNLF